MRIGNKEFMNLQEAVGWLLENNALPFQSTANYVGNTEIAMSTLINPSPAKVRVGSIIFFADSKVSTVVGVTSNSFIVSDQYNDLVDDIVYVSNVAINASGHLIVTLSNGDTIDAGLIKQVSNFSIDASQHLIVAYNDGTTTDLGAIFNGNINISGNLTVTGGISGNAITGDSIIENMTGYRFEKLAPSNSGIDVTFASPVKNGNKITFVIAGNVTRNENTPYNAQIGQFICPVSVINKLYPLKANSVTIDIKDVIFLKEDDLAGANVKLTGQLTKIGNYGVALQILGIGGTSLTLGQTYLYRYEVTFLLSENLAS